MCCSWLPSGNTGPDQPEVSQRNVRIPVLPVGHYLAAFERYHGDMVLAIEPAGVAASVYSPRTCRRGPTNSFLAAFLVMATSVHCLSMRSKSRGTLSASENYFQCSFRRRGRGIGPDAQAPASYGGPPATTYKLQLFVMYGFSSTAKHQRLTN